MFSLAYLMQLVKTDLALGWFVFFIVISLLLKFVAVDLRYNLGLWVTISMHYGKPQVWNQQTFSFPHGNCECKWFLYVLEVTSSQGQKKI